MTEEEAKAIHARMTEPQIEIDQRPGPAMEAPFSVAGLIPAAAPAEPEAEAG